MKKNEIITTLHELLIETAPDFKGIAIDDLCNTSLVEQGLDSINMLSFMVAIEDKFGIDWNENADIENVLKNFNTISDYILEQHG